MEPVDVALSFVIVLGVLALLDWVAPRKIRLFTFDVFKRDVDDFYAAYRRGYPIRLAVSVFMAVGAALVTVLSDKIALLLTIIASVICYMILMCYYMWLAETNRQPWQ